MGGGGDAAARAAFIEQHRSVDGALADEFAVNCYDGADTTMSEEAPTTLPPIAEEPRTRRQQRRQRRQQQPSSDADDPGTSDGAATKRSHRILAAPFPLPTSHCHPRAAHVTRHRPFGQESSPSTSGATPSNSSALSPPPPSPCLPPFPLSSRLRPPRTLRAIDEEAALRARRAVDVLWQDYGESGTFWFHALAHKVSSLDASLSVRAADGMVHSLAAAYPAVRATAADAMATLQGALFAVGPTDPPPQPPCSRPRGRRFETAAHEAPAARPRSPPTASSPP